MGYTDRSPGTYLTRKTFIVPNGMNLVRIAIRIARVADWARRPGRPLDEEVPSSEPTEEEFGDAAMEEFEWREFQSPANKCPVCGEPAKIDEDTGVVEMDNICTRCKWQDDGTSAGWSHANHEFIEDAKSRWMNRSGN